MICAGDFLGPIWSIPLGVAGLPGPDRFTSSTSAWTVVGEWVPVMLCRGLPAQIMDIRVPALATRR
jgi:hypothetical protein